MSIYKSAIEEVELSSGGSLYVQAGGRRASLSYDGKDSSMTVWLKPQELKQLSEAIDKLIKSMQVDEKGE